MSDTATNNKFYRFEFKYQVPIYLFNKIKDEFERMGYKDGLMHDREFYYVTSLYFDTPQFSDFHDKAGGFIERKKIRARIYDGYLSENTNKIWLEVKHKRDMRVFKERVEISQAELEQIINFKNPGRDEAVLNKILFHIFREQRRPVAFIRYKRKPYLFKIGGIEARFTLDYDIEACAGSHLGHNGSMTKIHPQSFVLEVKFDKFLPGWFDFIIKKYDLRRDTFSKYAYSIEHIRKFNPIPR